MRTPVSNNAFARHTDKVYNRLDPYDLCPVCGEYIYWPDEEIGWDENEQICHVSCVEHSKKEESYG